MKWMDGCNARGSGGDWGKVLTHLKAAAIAQPQPIVSCANVGTELPDPVVFKRFWTFGMFKVNF